jgi:hypothetical protein
MAELSEMIYDRGLRDWELKPAYNATMDDMDLEHLNTFLAQRATSGQRSSRFKNIERILVGMRCAGRHRIEKPPKNSFFKDRGTKRR